MRFTERRSMYAFQFEATTLRALANAAQDIGAGIGIVAAASPSTITVVCGVTAFMKSFSQSTSERP
jgi:hypothetical protein